MLTFPKKIIYDVRSFKSLDLRLCSIYFAPKPLRQFSTFRCKQRSVIHRSEPPRRELFREDSERKRLTGFARAFRKDLDHKAFARLVCERLDLLASENEGSELSTLARQESHSFGQFSIETSGKLKKSPPPLYHTFHQAFSDHGPGGLDFQIKYSLQGQLANATLSHTNLEDQSKLADLRYPVEWYPLTRRIQRTLHLHVGPTNSGKTYQALQRLERAKTGIYAGPLRLLAYEVYTRLNAKGKSCHLITGDDRRISEGEEDAMISCTIEMVPTDRVVDVAVVDEVQLIGDEARGWAWSQALLGLQAKELHLCGEARTLPLIRELAAQMGDKLEIYHYERLSPLKLASSSLGGHLTKLRKGDCLVVFSRKEIHALKSEIERKTNKRVAIIYGSLPPETRASQARLFNDPSNDYDYLVASDAIGMGLNLDIKRIVFESTYKFNGFKVEAIPIPHLKQIAGRAGRYRIAPQSTTLSTADANLSQSLPSAAESRASVTNGTVGLVTSLEKFDFARVREAMQTEAEPIMTAGLFPPTQVILRFAAYFPPRTPFSYILRRLHEVSSLHPRYHLCKLKDHIIIADLIEDVQDLTVTDRIIFCDAPASGSLLPGFNRVVVAFAECVARNTNGALLDIESLNLEVLDQEITTKREYLLNLEVLHRALILYIWLSYRFAGIFHSEDTAFYVKGMVEERIDKVLAQVSSSRKRKIKTLRQLAMLEELGSAYGEKEDAREVEQLAPAAQELGQDMGWNEREENADISLGLEEPLSSEQQGMGPLRKNLAPEKPDERWQRQIVAAQA